jgi:hypothetical protein
MPRATKICTLLACIAFFSGCLAQRPGLLVPMPLGLNAFNRVQGGVQRLAAPTREHFSICHGHTCRFIAEANLSPQQWSEISTAFAGGLESAEQERVLLPVIIGLIESMVGVQTGTAGDLAQNFTHHGESGQMDCIDESSNTLTYLTLLEDGKLLTWHRAGVRINRGPYSLVIQVPHSAAGMVEIASGDRYAVDSWFGANGEPALVLPYDQWARGYRPALTTSDAPIPNWKRRKTTDVPTGWQVKR